METFLTYVVENCRNYSEGRGNIFVENAGALTKYPEGASSVWIPQQQLTKLQCMSNLTFMTGEWLEKLYSDIPDMNELTPEQVDFIKSSTGGILKLHALVMDHVKRQIQEATSVERFMPD